MQSLIQIIRKDSRTRKLHKSFRVLSHFNLPHETLVEEIQNIHEVRKTRTIRLKENSVDAIIQANIQDQSFRSRLVEINMTVLKAQRRLESALEALTNYILIEYAENLKVVKTKEERIRALTVALSPFYKYVEKMQEVKEQSDLVIQDIDKAAFSLKLTVEAMKISTQRETYI